ncbi:MAG: carboxypeptidase regulatory-like domain-containing protein, partial [Deltaproteobacteria bacterium]|nr:carboxypeptidase regulatory-like domain-containing protein [Deltaproteobacteria bacterium]
MTRIVGAAAFLLLFVTGCSSSSSDACDPIAQTGCDEGLVCEEVVDGGPACFAPVVLRGNVFDRADDSAIEGATVVALDANSSPASTVGVTDASGDYEMQVARQRDADGNPLGGDVTLRADAAGFQLVVQTTATDIGLIALPSGAGTNQIFGNVEVPDDSTGVLVVAETAGDSPLGFTAITDRDGVYRIFNLPDGDFSVLGYARGVNYGAQTASVSGGQDVQVDLAISADAPGTVTGSVQIVNPGAGEGTSYILVVESTFNAALARGETPPGLRAPEGTGLVESGTWMIEGVPVGSYKVLGAFENDRLVR